MDKMWEEIYGGMVAPPRLSKIVRIEAIFFHWANRRCAHVGVENRFRFTFLSDCPWWLLRTWVNLSRQERAGPWKPPSIAAANIGEQVPGLKLVKILSGKERPLIDVFQTPP